MPSILSPRRNALGQTTDKVKLALKRGDTTIVMVPPGTTSKIQPLDVAVNSEFKEKVDKLSIEYMSKNMNAFLKGDITTSALTFGGRLLSVWCLLAGKI